jgi:hypothetical protein
VTAHPENPRSKKDMEHKYDWELNASTGNYILRLTPNTSVIRMAGGGLYSGEYWGDYSLRYPKKGPWRKTLKQAKQDITKMAADCMRIEGGF